MKHIMTKAAMETPITQQATAALTKLLRQGDPTLVAVAKHLQMTPRTLQRRLADEGQSFKSLLDDFRYQLALQLLDAGDLTIQEIAHQLGFSETSAFHRAFRRWTGSTPVQFRGRQRP